MATRIKAVKCPQCGSEKHEQLDEKRYRCLNCGTEFFLDDDDINVNVNHHYDFQSSNFLNNDLSTGIKLAIGAVVVPLIVVFVIAIFLTTSSSGSSSDSSSSTTVRDLYTLVSPMNNKGKPCVFYLVERDFNTNYSSTGSKYVNGYYMGFRDAITGKVLKEQLFMSEDDADKQSISPTSDTELSYLKQAKHWYLVLAGRFVYEVNPASLTITDVSQSFFKGKQAMNTGIASIKFIYPADGEGFKVENNIAESYYYFPATNRLYTEEAFNYARQLPPSQLNGEVRDTLYWQLISKSPNNNTDRKGLLRLWNIHAKYHLGDPQDFGFYDWFYGTFSSDRGGRFVSATPMTDWFVGFNGQFIYQDAHYALIYFNPSLASDARSMFRLYDKTGKILWTQVLDRFSEVVGGERVGNVIWIIGKRNRRNTYDDMHAYGFDISTGKWEKGAELSTEYTIE